MRGLVVGLDHPGKETAKHGTPQPFEIGRLGAKVLGRQRGDQAGVGGRSRVGTGKAAQPIDVPPAPAARSCPDKVALIWLPKARCSANAARAERSRDGVAMPLTFTL